MPRQPAREEEPNLLEAARIARNRPSPRSKYYLRQSLHRQVDESDTADLIAIADHLISSGIRGPFSTQLERSILGAMLLDSKVCDRVLAILTESEFHDRANWVMFRCLTEARGSGVPMEGAIVWDYMKENGWVRPICEHVWGTLTDNGGVRYLAEIVEAAAGDWRYVAMRLRQLTVDRERHMLAERMFDLLHSAKVGDWLAEIEEATARLRRHYDEVAKDGEKAEFGAAQPEVPQRPRVLRRPG